MSGATRQASWPLPAPAPYWPPPDPPSPGGWIHRRRSGGCRVGRRMAARAGGAHPQFPRAPLARSPPYCLASAAHAPTNAPPLRDAAHYDAWRAPRHAVACRAARVGGPMVGSLACASLARCCFGFKGLAAAQARAPFFLLYPADRQTAVVCRDASECCLREVCGRCCCSETLLLSGQIFSGRTSDSVEKTVDGEVK